MAFDRPVFLLFLAIVFWLYHSLSHSHREQNIFLVLCSYVFYAWFSWQLSFLLLLYAFINYSAGYLLTRHTKQSVRKRIMFGAIALDLCVLGYFKYANFFLDNFRALLTSIGLSPGSHSLRILLPIGISFYTFQAISYVVDVYRGDVEAERNPWTLAAYLFFFPQLVAGPIERAKDLLRQFRKPRTVDRTDIRQGTWLVIWGLFLKKVIADRLAPYADMAFTSGHTDGILILLGTLAFALQIYCDFNGYSLIAKGAAQLLGFRLVWNFRHPYWATSIQDFWRRWHISLSTWLRDYLYIPLGGNRRGLARTGINLFITMFLGGLWHGASWNFVAWGILHAVALTVCSFWSRAGPTRLPRLPAWLATHAVVFVGWLIFRVQSAEGFRHVAQALPHLTWLPLHTQLLSTLGACICILFVVEALQQTWRDMVVVTRLPQIPFAIVTAILILAIFTAFGDIRFDFIYFQF